jgi:hypothetical protein
MSDDDFDALLRASFPANRWSLFLGRRTWFVGLVESVTPDAITLAGLDGYTDWEAICSTSPSVPSSHAAATSSRANAADGGSPCSVTR